MANGGGWDGRIEWRHDTLSKNLASYWNSLNTTLKKPVTLDTFSRKLPSGYVFVKAIDLISSFKCLRGISFHIGIVLIYIFQATCYMIDKNLKMNL